MVKSSISVCFVCHVVLSLCLTVVRGSHELFSGGCALFVLSFIRYAVSRALCPWSRQSGAHKWADVKCGVPTLHHVQRLATLWKPSPFFFVAPSARFLSFSMHLSYMYACGEGSGVPLGTSYMNRDNSQS